MENKYRQQIKQWIADHREEMIADIVRLVRIRSVSQPGEGNTPFGTGCRDALHTMLEMASGYGFAVRNYDDIIGEIDLGRSGQTVGFWGHLDVVPEGDGWDYPPYEGIVTHGLIIGRGAQDNKGQTVAVLYLMRCFKELQIPLEHNLKLFVGTSEEAGMADLEWFLAHHDVPPFSIIADSNYPVCYGEKGIITAAFTGAPLSNAVESLSGGSAPNVVPSQAAALLRLDSLSDEARQLLSGETADGDILKLEATGSGGHTAFPQNSVNALDKLFCRLLGDKILPESDAAVLDFFARISSSCFGEALNIAQQDEMSGQLTCVASMLSMQGRQPVLTVNIRYPVTADGNEICRRLTQAGESAGCTVNVDRLDPAHYFPRNHPAVDILTDVYRQITGDERAPFVLPGGTYSRKLHRSISFGMGFSGEEHPDKKGFFRKGHGGAHGPDECTVIAELLVSIEIYAEGLMAIDHLDWEDDQFWRK